MRTPLLQTRHPLLRVLNPLTYVLFYPISNAPEDCAERILYGLFESGPGLSRRNSKGDDIGRTGFHGDEDAKTRVWKHTKAEMERALAVPAKST